MPSCRTTFAGTSCALLLLSFLAAGVPSAFARRRPMPTKEDIAYSQHLMRVLQFPCSSPQPRALSSADVIDEAEVHISPLETIFPVMTVLHRCDAGSGCCMQGSGLTCGPDRESEVQLDFKLLNAKNGKLRHVIVTTHNHTKCACMENLPK